MRRRFATIMAHLLAAALLLCVGIGLGRYWSQYNAARDSIAVDIHTDQNGYVSMTANADIDYGRTGQIQSITLSEPTVLAFQAGEQWDSGVCLLSGADVLNLETVLEEALEGTAAEDELQAALDRLWQRPVYTFAST